jgi:hypothetical protein
VHAIRGLRSCDENGAKDPGEVVGGNKRVRSRARAIACWNPEPYLLASVGCVPLVGAEAVVAQHYRRARKGSSSSWSEEVGSAVTGFQKQETAMAAEASRDVRSWCRCNHPRSDEEDKLIPRAVPTA